MSENIPEHRDHSKSLLPDILLTGLLAGTLDMTAAIVQFCIPTPRSPVRIFEFIASGVFGTTAFSGGVWMSVAGVLFHYTIALAWTSVYFTVYPRIPFLSRHAVVAGLLYGMVVWVIMNVVVLPLTDIPHFPLRLKGSAIGMGILMVAIGLPVALRARAHYRKG